MSKSWEILGVSALALLAGLAFWMGAGADAQVVAHPNEIIGTVGFSNTNPDILQVLDSQGLLDEGLVEIRFEARSQGVDPELLHRATASSQTGFGADFSVAVEAGPIGDGTVFLVTPVGVLDDVDHSYWVDNYAFEPQLSPPVERSPSPPVEMHFQECAGLIEVRWQDADGQTVIVNDGWIKASAELPDGNFESRGSDSKFVQASEREYVAVRGDGSRHWVRLQYELGTDPYSDTLRFEENLYDIEVHCDQITEVVITVPSAETDLGRIVGDLDIVGEDERRWQDLSLIRAYSGPGGNGRRDTIDAVPSEGGFELENLVPGSYGLLARLAFGEGRDYQYFEVPHLQGPNGVATVAPGETLDLGTTFRIDPGYVGGTIRLAAPPSDIIDGFCLGDLHFIEPLGASQYSYSLGNSNHISSLGLAETVPGSSYSAHRGLAQTQFHGEPVLDPRTPEFVGSYSLALGTLDSEPSLWTGPRLEVYQNDPFTEEEQNWFIRIDDLGRSPVEVLAGGFEDYPLHYCFGALNVDFRTAGGEIFHDATLQGEGSFLGVDFEGQQADHEISIGWIKGRNNNPWEAQPQDVAASCLPAGTYELRPSFALGDQGGNRVQLPRLENVVVGCRQIKDLTMGLDLQIDDVPACVDTSLITITGRAKGTGSEPLPIDEISYTVDGAASQAICLGCGEDPEFSQEIPLATCDNRVKVTATDVDGRATSTTFFTRFDDQPAEWSGCDAIAIELEAGQSSAIVDFNPMAVDACSGVLEVTCDVASGSTLPLGETVVTCQAVDECSVASTCSFPVTITALAGQPPEILSTPPTRAVEGEAYSYPVVAVDPDGDALSYVLVDGPAGLTLDASGLVSWTPPIGMLGDFPVTVEVRDPSGESDSQTWSIGVVASVIDRSHLGRDFWLAFTQNGPRFGAEDGLHWSSEERKFWLSISSRQGSSGVVEVPGFGFEQAFTVPAGEAIRIDLPNEVMHHEDVEIGVSAEGFRSRTRPGGVHISADEPIGVVAVNQRPGTSDSFLVYPTPVLGSAYTVPAFNSKNQAQLTVVATEDGTEVLIRPPLGVVIQPPPGQAVENPLSLTLNRGDVYSTWGDSELGETFWLSGTEVRANKPLALFAGNKCAHVPTIDFGFCDHLVEHVFADANAGSYFLTYPLATRFKGDLFRFVAIEDQTQVWVGGVLTATLARGEFSDRLIEGPSEIVSNRPIHVTQLSTSDRFDNELRMGSTLADPFSILLNPVATFLSSYAFLTPAPDDEDFLTYYANVVIETSAIGTLTLDGQAVSTAGFEPIPGTSYSGASLFLEPGMHEIEAASPFGLNTYAYGEQNSYGTAAGLVLGHRDRVEQIVTTPRTQEQSAGEEACVDYVLLSNVGHRVPFVRVDIRVVGARDLSASQYSDESGAGRYCYRGTDAGVETLALSAGDAFDSVEVTWTSPSGPQAPEIVSIPNLRLRDAEFRYEIRAIDPNGDAVTYSLAQGPAGATVDASSGLVLWTPPVPADRESSVHLFVVRASDGGGAMDEQAFELVVIYPPLLVEPVDPEEFATTEYAATAHVLGGDALATQLRVLAGPSSLEVTGADSADRSYRLTTSGFDLAPRQAMSTFNPLCREGQDGLASLHGELRWSSDPLSNLILPVAGRLRDTDGDGLVTASDHLFFVGLGSQLVAIDAHDGSIAFQTSGQAFRSRVIPAIADLDGDGSYEILVEAFDPSAGDYRLTAFDSDGALSWIGSHAVLEEEYAANTATSIEVIDLEGDGSLEIVTGPRVFDAGGQLLWSFPIEPAISEFFVHEAFPLIVDLDGDGQKEVLFRNEARRADGSLVFSLDGAVGSVRPVAQFATADLDGDGWRDVVASVHDGVSDALWAFDRFGSVLWGPLPVADAAIPAIADFDRDGAPEIFYPRQEMLIDADGRVVGVNRPTGSLEITRAAVADLNGDGLYEFLHQTNNHLEVFDVLSGYRWLDFSVPNRVTQLSRYGSTLIVDSDGDGHGEVFLGGSGVTSLLQAQVGEWPSAPVEQPSYGMELDGLATFGVRTALSELPGRRPDLWIGETRLSEQAGGLFEVDARVENRGTATLSSDVTVRLYRRAPEIGELLGEVVLPGLSAADGMTISVGDLTQDQVSDELYVVASSSEAECESANNQVAAAVVELEVSDGPGRRDSYRYLLRAQEPPANPVIETVAPSTVAEGSLYLYDPVATDANIGDALRYEVSAASGTFPFGLRVDARTGQIRWQTEPGDLGTYRFRLSAVDLTSRRADQVVTLQVAPSSNQPPAITSEPPVVTFVGASYSYAVEAEDPEGQALTYELSTAPSGMGVDAAGLIQWTPAADQTGQHVVSVVVRDVEGAQTAQDFTITVTAEANLPPEIHTAPVTSAKVGRLYRYELGASDPEGAALSYSKITAPGGLFLNTGDGTITWTPSAAGAYPVTIRVSDGLFTVEQSWILEVSPQALDLSVELTATPLHVEANGVIELSTALSGAAGATTLVVTMDGAPVTLDAFGQAQVTALSTGSHLFVATVDDGYQTAEDRISVGIIDPADAAPPEVTILSPAEGAFITAPVPVRGTVTDENLLYWRLLLNQRSVVDSQREIASGTAPGIDMVLGTLDPTLLLNGTYALVLEATDQSGNIESHAVTVIVEGNMKVGHFSITLEDISVDLVGIPLRVTRTYDTRQKDELLDFGYGWSVDYQTLRVQESRTIGRFWRLVEQGGTFGQFCIRPNGDPVVSITLPNGRVEKFRARAEPECQPTLAFVNNVEIVFDKIGDTRAELVQTSFGSLSIIDGQLVDIGDPSTPVDVRHYVLTTRDGTRYEIDDTFGIRRIVDSNDNSVTYSDQGITHSSGQQLDFVRNAQGLITAIALPDGEILRYGYDSLYDLVSFTDQRGETAALTYEPGHYLKDLNSLAGRRASRNEYDDDGRLVAVIDANNRRIDMNHDIDARTETVTNRNGETTVYVYNERGNVLSETNALGETITRTYDDSDNQRSETNALGHTTSWDFDAFGNQVSEENALGEVTTFVYDDRDNILRQIDDAGVVLAVNTYDLSNNLRTITDAEGHVTQIQVSSRGELEQVTDAEGNITRFTYDQNGFQTSRTDPAGVFTEWSYDKMGNMLSQTTTRTTADGQVQVLLTQYEYDDKNRQTLTIDALGHETTMVYDDDDLLLRTVDARGHRVRHDYDTRGRMILTTYADGSTERMVYDNEGRRIESTDRDGRTTRMVYDQAGRPTETIHSDATPSPDDNPRTRVEYDAAGRTEATVDERGNRTEFEYDDLGRQVLIRDALGRETVTDYNNRGQRVSTTDANGRTVRYVYDQANRLVETIFPDSTPGDLSDNPRKNITYDGLGRRVLETDELSAVTRFEYDGRGNLVAVIDALDQRTEYGYDEQSNKITQTDASNRTTRWEYDHLGRVISRTLPLGQTETMSYDEVGNRVSKTDFNGQATTFIYDVNDRLARSIFDDLTVEDRAYSPNGLLVLVQDERGLTTYDHDERDRLKRIVYPDTSEVQYAYDGAGNKVALTTANQSVTYGYDALNRLETVDDVNGQTSYQYDLVGNRASETKANGASTHYGYDERNRLRRVEHRDAAQSVLLGITYTLNADGTRARIVEDAGRITDYTYDPLKRLEVEQVTDAALGNRTTSWAYDATGNRLTQDDAGVVTSYVYNANDQMIEEVTGSNISIYQYDANGSTTLKSVNGAVTATYQYDPRNRMTGSSVDGVISSYQYDENDIRRQKVENGQITNYLIDPTQTYSQVIEESDSQDQLLVAYTFGDDLISQQRQAGGISVTSYYHYDGLGSTRLLTDSAAQTQSRYVFTAFGLLEHETGNVENSFLYTGEQFDPSLGSYYLRARYYDPSIGRFGAFDTYIGQSDDPFSLHKYLYTRNNPSNWTDPSGNVTLMELSVVNSIITEMISIQFDSGLTLLENQLPADHELQNGISVVRMGTTALGAASLIAAAHVPLKLLARGLEEERRGRGWVRFLSKGGSRPLAKEKDAALFLAEKNGSRIFIRGRGAQGSDFLMDGVKWELKTLNAATTNAVGNNIKKSMKKGNQGTRFVIDGRKVGIDQRAAIEGIKNAIRDEKVPTQVMVLLGNGEIFYWP